MSRPIIEVRGLSKQYRLGRIGFTSLRAEVERWWARLRGRAESPNESDFWALRDVSFDVAPGEVTGIIGRNGAGKSTLLKILSEITEPSAGEIRIRGHVASLLEVGTGFHPELSGRENIFLNGATLGMKRAEIRRKFDEIVAFAEVEKFLDTPVKRYSSGMYVRLAFAVAAHLEPEILLIDEVLAVGDHAFQQKCLGKMNDVARKEGRTVLFVSHNMAAVSRLCQQAILFQSGRITANGPADVVVGQYLAQMASVRSEWSAAADRSKGHPVSFLNGRITDENGKPISVVPFNSSIIVELECQEHTSAALWGVRASILDQQGHELICALDTDLAATRGSRPDRVHRLRCIFPAGLLRPGMYSITASIYELAGDQPVALYDEVEPLLALEISAQGYATYSGRALLGTKAQWAALA
jgi:lipopolysaccharide transport system ATP-binding protein